MTAREKSAVDCDPARVLHTMNLVENPSLFTELLNSKNQAISAPMSKGQEALWFIHQRAPDSAAFNLAVVLHIYSPIDREKLEEAVKLLVQRHEILRTSYALVQGKPRQMIHTRGGVQFDTLDARILTEEQLHARIVARYRQPFDLSAPPVRVHVYQLAHGESVFSLVAHQIAVDATSLWILMEELAEIYPALCRNEKPTLHDPGHSYRAFCRLQINWLAGEQGRADRAYWKKTLTQGQPPVTLGISRRRPPSQVYVGASHYFDVPEVLVRQINSLARQQSVNTFSCYLSAWYCLLASHSGQQDICISSPTNGRWQAGFQRCIGHFVNRVLFCISLGDNPSAGEFLRRVHHRVLEALEHQQYPFSSVIEAVNLRRQASFAPLAQVSFAFQTAHQNQGIAEPRVPGQEGPRVRWAGLDVRKYPLNQQEGQFELELEISGNREGYFGALKYSTALFSTGQIQNLAHHYRRILHSMVEQPQAPLAHLE